MNFVYLPTVIINHLLPKQKENENNTELNFVEFSLNDGRIPLVTRRPIQFILGKLEVKWAISVPSEVQADSREEQDLGQLQGTCRLKGSPPETATVDTVSAGS